jgi:quinol monooxygenase YgiN
MAVKLGILALLKAKPGKGDDLADFPRSGREIAASEEGTVSWYAFKVDDATYGIFDTFESEEGRQAHLNARSRRRSVR